MTEAKRPALLLVDLMNHFDFPGGDALGKPRAASSRRCCACASPLTAPATR
jgi:hypothetical protein